MRRGNLTREQAVAMVGECLVVLVERANCEPTNRVGYNGSCQGDGFTEWMASASAGDKTVEAYYYTSADEEDAAGDDLSSIDWVIEGYEVVE